MGDSISITSLSVHIAGGDYLTGVGLRQLLDDAGFIDVTGLSSHGAETVERVKAEQPDVVLIDELISNPGVVATTAALCGLAIHPKVVVLSNGGTGKHMDAVLRAGACSYLTKDSMLEDIAAALRIAHRGGSVTSADLTRANDVDYQAAGDAEMLERFRALNPRDIAIVEGLIEGHTNAQISRRLHLSEATVKARLTQLMQELGMDNRVQVAVAAVKAGVRTSETAPASQAVFESSRPVRTSPGCRTSARSH